MESQRLLALFHTPGIFSYQLPKLLKHFGCFETCMALTAPALIKEGVPERLAHAIQSPNWSLAEKCLSWQQSQANHHLCTLLDDDYPSLLKEIHSPPPVLFLKGNKQLLRLAQIAIVGSRRPSPTGVDIARQFASQLSDHGFAICSGLATGIDASAHDSALKNKQATLAVIGSGIDRYYPAKNKILAKKIEQQGLVISEYPLGTPPKASHFPQRNRIISGLSLGVLVVEAALKSGSLITAKLALEQGRDVFAIPGSIYNPLSKGCHALLQDGAKLTQSIQDILDEYPHMLPRVINEQTKSDHKRLAIELENLVKFVGYEITPIDVLLARTGLAYQALSHQLLNLEIQGLIQALPGGYIRLRP